MPDETAANSILRGLVEEAGTESWEPDTAEQRLDRAETQTAMGAMQAESLAGKSTICCTMFLSGERLHVHGDTAYHIDFAGNCYGCLADEPMTLTQKHMEHYRHCNCLGDSAECCVKDCECHDAA